MKAILFLSLFFASVVCDARLVFVHIPKTGGSTIRYLLGSNFHPSDIYPYGKVGQDRAGASTQQEMIDALNEFPVIDRELIWGHFPIWFLKKKDPDYDSSFLFTVLRDPIERVLSHGRYVEVDPSTITPNFMCRMLSSDCTLQGDELVNDCINNLKRMNYIIFMDDFDRDVTYLFNQLGLRVPQTIPQRNTTEKEPVSAELIEKLKIYNSLDVRLYEYAKNNLRQSVNR